eukprot:jgi/Mesvir1/17326/Mv07720-RA.1
MAQAAPRPGRKHGYHSLDLLPRAPFRKASVALPNQHASGRSCRTNARHLTRCSSGDGNAGRGEDEPGGSTPVDVARVSPALRLWQCFELVENPGSSGMSYDEAMKAFVRASILAYECGCSEDDLRTELGLLKVPRDEECLRWTSLVWLAVILAPRATVFRWATSKPLPVDGATMAHWQGFVKLIVDAYFLKGMAWYPVRKLQMEQLVTEGRAEHPAVVSERMRLVFTTLEIIAPQFPQR